MSRPAGGRRPGPDGAVQWGRALLIIAVLVVIGVFILNRTGSSPAGKSATTTTRPKTTSTTAPAPTTTVALVQPSQIKVQVLNGVLTGSLAGQWTTKLKSQFGYQTQPPDDATAKVSASVIYVVTPGYDAEARQLAASIGLAPTAVTSPLPATAPVKTAERTTSNLILVVGPDLAGTA
ncbi:MAG TPA: LytR C-terminal domain-containing protein [Acidimicrobiales bacterium]|nr:LytR C-terminal domain-containing protein [Acidimicrobiales bacterium]